MSTPEQMAEAQAIAIESVAIAHAAYDACFTENGPELCGIARVMIARGAQSVTSANLLAHAGLVGDAMACGRTVVELAIDFAYIATNPATLIARFEAYARIVDHKLMTNVAAAGGEVPNELMAEMERRRDEYALNNPGTLLNWAGSTIAERARVAGRVALYGLSYTDQCSASHSGPGTLHYALVRKDGQFQVRFGPHSPEAHPIMLAASGLNILVGDVVGACRLDEAIGHRSLELGGRMRALVDTDIRLPR